MPQKGVRVTKASTGQDVIHYSGTPCRDSGPSKGIDSLLTAVIAVDSVKGVISRMLYEKETTGDKFASLVQHLLLPAIEGTGTRVIAMDNLDGHSPAVKFVKAAGHYVVIHPIHSPDFGGVQWVFNFLDSFLQAHQSNLCNTNLREAMEAGFDCVTPQDVAGSMAKAHLCVEGHTFEPYMGQQ